MNALIHLIDDHDAFRESTSWLLEAAGFDVCLYAHGKDFLDRFESLTQTQEQAEGKKPACILSDVRMPIMSGIELLAEIKKRAIALPFVLITGHGDVALAVEAMRKGASHFIEKPFQEETLIEAIRASLEQALLPAQQMTNSGGVSSSQQSEELIAKLSVRERQLMEAVMAGKANKVISRELGISIKTVELHRAKMMSKLGAKHVADLFHRVQSRS